MDYIVIGGGGAGGGTSTWDFNGNFLPYSAGGGGGAGAIEVMRQQIIDNRSYTLSVGSGGSGVVRQDGNRGGSSVFETLTALGGFGGRDFPGSVPSRTGGTSADGVFGGFGPAQTNDPRPYFGGGGGGATDENNIAPSVGGDASRFSGGGAGGPEITTTLSDGFSITTSGGGRGGSRPNLSVSTPTSAGSGGRGAHTSDIPLAGEPGLPGRVLIRVIRA